MVKSYKYFYDTGSVSQTNMSGKNMPMLPVDSIYKLSNNYPDPFLKDFRAKTPPKKGNKNTTKIIKPKIEKITTEDISWPTFNITGVMINNKVKNKLVTGKFNNQDIILKEGDIIDKFVVSKIYKDSVVIKFENLSKTYYK